MDYSLFCCALKRGLPKLQLTRHRELPSRAINLISEYSKPLTHPEWRKSNPIVSIFKLYLSISPPTSELHYIILKNIKQTEWYKMYYGIHLYGIKYFNEDFYVYD
jgi:hypothetical protein